MREVERAIVFLLSIGPGWEWDLLEDCLTALYCTEASLHCTTFYTQTDHWCSKSMKSGFARAKVPCLKNLDVLLQRIDAQKWTDDILQDTKKNVWPEAYRGLETYLVARCDWAYFEKPKATSLWNCSVFTELHTLLNLKVLYILLYFTVLYAVLYFTVLNYVMYFIVLCILLYFSVLCTMVYFTVLWTLLYLKSTVHPFVVSLPVCW